MKKALHSSMFLRAHFLKGYLTTHRRACSGEKSGDGGRRET